VNTVRGVGSILPLILRKDEQQVIFRLTETREADVVHTLLENYAGIVISDFYPGYDAVPCTQQKCWVHLIRDLNNDLLKAPFDTELAYLVAEVRDLILPIMECIQRHGLQQRKLRRFKNKVKQFYNYAVNNVYYKSDLASKYQKRFLRYRNSLFTFLEHDGILWHNNPAERAIRPIAKQWVISTSFSASVTRDYLVLLGIRQTCRFQGKSFFKFLMSGETDLEQFAARKRKRSQVPVR
jgi:Transposase IS66 family